jgi:hypothetical protein
VGEKRNGGGFTTEDKEFTERERAGSCEGERDGRIAGTEVGKNKDLVEKRWVYNVVCSREKNGGRRDLARRGEKARGWI